MADQPSAEKAQPITGTCVGAAAGHGPCLRPCGVWPCTVDEPATEPCGACEDGCVPGTVEPCPRCRGRLVVPPEAGVR